MYLLFNCAILYATIDTEIKTTQTEQEPKVTAYEVTDQEFAERTIKNYSKRVPVEFTAEMGKHITYEKSGGLYRWVDVTINGTRRSYAIEN